MFQRMIHRRRPAPAFEDKLHWHHSDQPPCFVAVASQRSHWQADQIGSCARHCTPCFVHHAGAERLPHSAGGREFTPCREADRLNLAGSPLLPAVGGKQEVDGAIVQLRAAGQVRVDQLADGRRSIWKIPQLRWHLHEVLRAFARSVWSSMWSGACNCATVRRLLPTASGSRGVSRQAS